MPINELNELKESFINSLTPLKIYLFGSFAERKQSEDSDFDFYHNVAEDSHLYRWGMNATSTEFT